MDSGKLNDWIQTIGIIAVVVSLLFVGFEIRQSRQIAQMDQLGVAKQLFGDFQSRIQANPDVWFRGCAGETLTDAERVVFYSLVQELTVTSFIMNLRGAIGVYRGSTRYLENFAANLHRFPALREAYMAQAEFDLETAAGEFGGRPAFQRDLFAKIEELERVEPAPDADPALCGFL